MAVLSVTISWQRILNVICVFDSGLQMTDVELDARVTALKENGGGSSPNGNNHKA